MCELLTGEVPFHATTDVPLREPKQEAPSG
jgi:hypothetical protein